MLCLSRPLLSGDSESGLSSRGGSGYRIAGKFRKCKFSKKIGIGFRINFRIFKISNNVFQFENLHRSKVSRYTVLKSDTEKGGGK